MARQKVHAKASNDTPEIRPDGDEPMVLDNNPIRVFLGNGFEITGGTPPKKLTRPMQKPIKFIVVAGLVGTDLHKATIPVGPNGMKIRLETEDKKASDTLLVARSGSEVVLSFTSGAAFRKQGKEWVHGSISDLRVVEVLPADRADPIPIKGPYNIPYDKVVMILSPA
jgi:hypothetical protein